MTNEEISELVSRVESLGQQVVQLTLEKGELAEELKSVKGERDVLGDDLLSTTKRLTNTMKERDALKVDVGIISKQRDTFERGFNTQSRLHGSAAQQLTRLKPKGPKDKDGEPVEVEPARVDTVANG